MIMTRLTPILILILISVLYSLNRPFPQSLSYTGCIKPDNVTQDQINRAVSDLFDYYKSEYLENSVNTPGGYYIRATGNGDGGETATTISEAHGYGMITFALMAGYDQDAQEIFDGMFHFYKSHPSKNNEYTMSWIVGPDESYASSTSATDGDMDIAYSLLLAHTQWGSGGAVDYLDEAQKIIEYGIYASDMGHNTGRILLGDWSTNPYSTRCSDWMPTHLRIYAEAMDDDFWLDAADTVYSLISSLTESHSPVTGLMPDFVDGATPYPDPTAGGTDEMNAENYSYNGCRFPMRIAADFAHYGTSEAKAALDRLLTWLRGSTGEDPSEIRGGYYLDGTPISDIYDLVFAAPFAAGAITDTSNQDFLNKLWAKISVDRAENEYELGINLLSTMLISGNWWKPQIKSYVEPSDIRFSTGGFFEYHPAGTFIGKITTIGGMAPYLYELSSGTEEISVRSDSVFSARSFRYRNEQEINFSLTVQDDSLNSFTKEFSVTILEAGENLLSGLNWRANTDSYGSTVDISQDSNDDSQLSACFSMTENNPWGGEWVYGTLHSAKLPKTMENSENITITYSSSAPFTLALPMESVSDSAYYAVELTASEEPVTRTFALNKKTFKQPETWGERASFTLAEVENITVNTSFSGSAGEISISELKVDNMAAGGVSVQPVSALSKKGVNGVISSRGIELTIPSGGDYNLTLYSISGRELFNETRSLAGGSSLIQLSGVNDLRGMVILRITGNGIQHSVKGTIR